MQDTCLWIFNKRTGERLAGFGLKGRGPGELLFPSPISYDRDNRLLVVFEANLNKIIRYDLGKVLSGAGDFYSEIRLNPREMFGEKPNFISDARPYKEAYMIRSKTDQMRFGILGHDGKAKTMYTRFLPLVEDKEENWALFSYSTQWAIKPDQTKMVYATYIGGVMEIFNINEERFALDTACYFYEPIYSPSEGVVPKWLVTRDETIVGFERVDATDDYIYALVVGEAYPPDAVESRKKLFVFDWNGNAYKQYVFPPGIRPESVAVDEEQGCIYAIVVKDGLTEFLCKFSIK
ncbi:MAG: 6-bladed beta-propeller [Odoribacteraceae bacterium]|nr:6-bladed beta-propeller [Odoribacteraceae bacterium]